MIGTLDLEGALADPVPEVVEFGAADLAAAGNLDLGNTRGVKLKDPLDPFAIGDFSDREGRVDGAATLGNHDACKDLNALLASLSHKGVNFHAITHVEIGDLFLELLLLYFPDDVHGILGVRLGFSGRRQDGTPEGGEGYTMPPADAIVF